MKTALVTGGAGYIGSHCLKPLKAEGWDVVVVDNLSTGHKKAAAGFKLETGDIGDPDFLDKIFSSYSISAVLHFAASAYVGESVENPAKYYRNNVVNGLNLLTSMLRNDVKDLIFSSTCATYGNPTEIPITENHSQNPVNPYGYTKMVFERMAIDLARSSGLRPVFLRYFNAAGASDDGLIGEDHDPEAHLIPLTIATALGSRGELTIFGDDYPTNDGTCVRDYIHISDLADAHMLALEYLQNGGEPTAFNLGNGEGYSVRQVIETVEKVSGKPVKVKMGARREGDPPALIGSAEKARKVLGWLPKFPDLESIVRTAYKWHETNPNGYS
ncbi:UDP-glucose 4-epimerase [hydrothermal vent metagenome]|uniref:UDP-glucose 4-epimerase n=1 Tax=hydrothermal vent metagenome TaxID=652676 RepID=A0A3B1C111_9ZZZZ